MTTRPRVYVEPPLRREPVGTGRPYRHRPDDRAGAGRTTCPRPARAPPAKRSSRCAKI